jgi:hypothetical protein
LRGETTYLLEIGLGHGLVLLNLGHLLRVAEVEVARRARAVEASAEGMSMCNVAGTSKGRLLHGEKQVYNEGAWYSSD